MHKTILTFLFFLQTLTLIAAPKADLWPVWEKHDPTANRKIDHSAFGEFLSKYLVNGEDNINRLSYAKVTMEDRDMLDDYIDRLSDEDISVYNRNEQMAFWINLYNALTVQVVLEYYPVDSITDIDISPGLFSNGPWDKKILTLGGEELSLNDIEHRILRPIWKDDRIHYAVNCASIGCPNLASMPYSAKILDGMLDKARDDYLSHSRGVQKTDDDEILVSSIFDWYVSDFGGSEKELLKYLAKHTPGELGEKIGSGEIDSVKYDYDWKLNEAR